MLRARYRRWACDVPEGALRRDWRLHPIAVARGRAWLRDVPTHRELIPAIRECLGLRPARPRRIRYVAWGGRSFDRQLVPMTCRYVDENGDEIPGLKVEVTKISEFAEPISPHPPPFVPEDHSLHPDGTVRPHG